MKNRIFKIFDQNEDGCLSVDEYIENLRRFTNKDNPEESIRFLFKIFDIDGKFSIQNSTGKHYTLVVGSYFNLPNILISETGQISEEEFLKSIKGAVKHNGMSFNETELKQLTSAFWSETETDGDAKIGYYEFRDRIMKHPGLPEKLSAR